MSDKIETFVWQFNITFACLFLLLSMASGCAPTAEPPETISIDPDFSVEEADTIRSATDAWCGAVGWCPKETDEVSARGRISRTDVTGRESALGLVVGYNDTWRIVLAPGVARTGMFWTMVAHEIGHWCTTAGMGVDGLGHTRTGLMAAVQRSPAGAIDADAVRLWREGCPGQQWQSIASAEQEIVGDVGADPNPLTFWWYATGADHQDRARSSIECALGRWRAATGLPLDISLNAHHWIRFAPITGASGQISGPWSSVRIRIDSELQNQFDCPVLVHEICHLLRLSNSHIGEACMSPTHVDSTITSADLDAVCAERDCAAYEPEVSFR